MLMFSLVSKCYSDSIFSAKPMFALTMLMDNNMNGSIGFGMVLNQC